MKISIDNPAEVLCPICRASNEDTGCQGTNCAAFVILNSSGSAFLTKAEWEDPNAKHRKDYHGMCGMVPFYAATRP